MKKLFTAMTAVTILSVTAVAQPPNTLWTRTYGGGDSDMGYSVQQTSDGGYIIAGRTISYGAGLNDFYLIRLESEISLMLIMTPAVTPVQIPAGGGSFSFNAQIFNNSNNAVTFDAWSEVILPNGSNYGTLILRENLLIQGGQTIIREGITQYVPPNAPAGIYDYLGYIGVYPDSIAAFDNIALVKLPGDGAPAHNQGWDYAGWEDDEEAVGSQRSILLSQSV